MNESIHFGGDLHIFVTAIFCLLGYFNGYLLRDMGLYKIIGAVLIIPACLQTLIDINDVISATLPFLVSAWIGHIGMRKAKRYALEFIDLSREVIDRCR